MHATIDKQWIGPAPPFYQCWLPRQFQCKITTTRQQQESQKKQWVDLGEKTDVGEPYIQAGISDHIGVFIEIVGKEKSAGPLKVHVDNVKSLIVIILFTKEQGILR